MPTALERTYLKIGRLYVQSIEFSERVQGYLEILEFAEFSDVVDFAAASGKARKKPNCNPAKSQLCGNACVSLSKKCAKETAGAEKQAAGFNTKAVAAKKEKPVKEVAPKTPKATKSKAKKVDEVIEPVAAKAVQAKPRAEDVTPPPKAETLAPVKPASEELSANLFGKTRKTTKSKAKKVEEVTESVAANAAQAKPKAEEITPTPNVEKSTATKSDFPDDAKLAAAERSTLAGLKMSLNKDAIAKLKVDGKEYFSKTVKKVAANAEFATKVIADDLGVGDYFLPVKVLSQGAEPTIVNPLIKPDPRKDEGGDPFDARSAPNMDPVLASRLATFDLITAQDDRHAGNIIKSEGKIYGIDNEMAFGNDGGYGGKKTGLHIAAIKNNMFRAAYLGAGKKLSRWEHLDTDADTPLDVKMIGDAVKNVDRHAQLLADKGLNASQYRERLKLLQKVAESNMPTFNNLFKQIEETEETD